LITEQLYWFCDSWYKRNLWILYW